MAKGRNNGVICVAVAEIQGIDSTNVLVFDLVCSGPYDVQRTAMHVQLCDKLRHNVIKTIDNQAGFLLFSVVCETCVNVITYS